MNKGKIIRWCAIVLIAGALIGLMIMNAVKPVDHSDVVWAESATIGKMDAKNYYIYYTDLGCPYCNMFSHLILENEDAFKREYIEGKNILYEVRTTDFLYEYGEHKPDMSRWSAEGFYCAADEGKAWDYYKTAIAALWDDYLSKGIGTSKTAPMITGMTADYWKKIGHKIGLGNQFDSCFDEHKMVDKILANTAKAAQKVQGGLPYYKFNKFTTGGFDPSWDWDGVKKLLDAGL